MVVFEFFDLCEFFEVFEYFEILETADLFDLTELRPMLCVDLSSSFKSSCATFDGLPPKLVLIYGPIPIVICLVLKPESKFLSCAAFEFECALLDVCASPRKETLPRSLLKDCLMTLPWRTAPKVEPIRPGC